MDKEKKWISDVKTGDARESAGKLIEKYYKEIYAFVYRQCGNKDDAMDLTQDTFTSFLTSTGTS